MNRQSRKTDWLLEQVIAKQDETNHLLRQLLVNSALTGYEARISNKLLVDILEIDSKPEKVDG